MFRRKEKETTPEKSKPKKEEANGSDSQVTGRAVSDVGCEEGCSSMPPSASTPGKQPRFLPSRMWSMLVDAVCRPPRDVYEIDDLIGRTEGYFYLGTSKFVREDLVLKNFKGQDLQCSLFRAFDKERDRDKTSTKSPSPSPTPPSSASPPPAKQTPCVVYCHCNSGSRRDAEEALLTLLPVGVSVFALDFSGSGLSGGDWVTLGHSESKDIGTAITYLRGRGDIGRIGLWGRSMGAVSALMYASTDPSVACMVLDSPFSDLLKLTHDISKCLGIPLPRPVASLAISFLRRSVRRRAGFDMVEVSPINLVGKAFVPALFCHAKQDDFILPTHSKALYDAYAGDKNYITFDGDHNSCRPHFFYTSVTIFMHNALGAKELMVGLMGAPPQLREPTRKALKRGQGEYRLGEKGGLHVEPLPAWLEKRVQKRVEKLNESEETGPSSSSPAKQPSPVAKPSPVAQNGASAKSHTSGAPDRRSKERSPLAFSPNGSASTTNGHSNGAPSSPRKMAAV